MEMEKYFKELEEYVNRCYEIAKAARSLGFDPSKDVEIAIAKDLASRVEGLLNIKGIANIIREKELEGKSRAELAVDVSKEVFKMLNGNLEERIEKALRVALAIVTEGVVSAPIEGIVKVKIKNNFDGTKYLAVYYAGPIRSAGGTAQALSVLFADILRREAGLDRYKPTEEEVERYVEEFEIYFQEVGRLQYKPEADEIRIIAKNVPIEITGEATEDVEVSGYRDLERVETNKLRGGALLVIAEGLLQKAKKLIKFIEKFNLDGWDFLKELVKDENSGEHKIEPDDKYLKEIVAGRPVLCYPSRKGGFRLRYGRTRTSGLAAVALHPSTLAILDGFIAIGTQLKLERPGKAGVVTVCDTIEPPIVKLKDGSVIRVEDNADKIKEDIDEILFLGDILIAVGEFLQNNHVILPTGYVEEFWVQELEKAIKEKGLKEYEKYLDIKNIPNHKEAVEISLKLGIPLHPRYTYHYNEVNKEDLRKLVKWIIKGRLENDSLVLEYDEDGKRILEELLVPHFVKNGKVIIKEYYPLLYSLGIWDFNVKRFEKAYNESKDSMDLVNKFIKIRPKATFYIGARMGRPEKSDARKMQPPVNVLFPLSNYGGRTRSVRKAAEKKFIQVEIVRRVCKNCKNVTIFLVCERCGSETELEEICPKCKRTECNCNIEKKGYERRLIDIEKLLSQAIKRVGSFGGEIKGVLGLTSKNKVPEILEKGILRSKYGLYVFKDGTCRFDMTNIPMTHFKPKEINVSVKKLRELGYDKDIFGRELVSDDQIIELKPHDIIVSENCLEYLFKVSKFIDELLTRVYGLEPFYNAKTKEDLIGHLVIGLAPHTSCGIIGRIIGYTKVQGCFAHPYWHAAKRRNADGDEDSVMLLLDAFLNFSKEYLPNSRGGKMDAPLVINTRINPMEVDDEVHKLDVCQRYPLEFYLKTYEYPKPSDIEDFIENVSKRLGKEDQFKNLMFTHDTSDINRGPIITSYKKLETMSEKVKKQLALAGKIRACDEKDVAKRLIESHFIRDAIGNLRSFSTQGFRCTSCNKIYRRIPLYGKCSCGGNLVLTVSKGAVEKYLGLMIDINNKYIEDEYLKQRIELLIKNIAQTFGEDERLSLVKIFNRINNGI